MSSPTGGARLASVFVAVLSAACAHKDSTVTGQWTVNASPALAATTAAQLSPADSPGDWGQNLARSRVDSAAAVYAAGAPISLIDLDGDWSMRSVPTAGDTAAEVYVLHATGFTTGWTLTLADGPRIGLDVTLAGDSIVTHAGPFESVGRKGVSVVADASLRLRGDSLVGRTLVHLGGGTADSVLTLRTFGARLP